MLSLRHGGDVEGAEDRDECDSLVGVAGDAVVKALKFVAGADDGEPVRLRSWWVRGR